MNIINLACLFIFPITFGLYYKFKKTNNNLIKPIIKNKNDNNKTNNSTNITLISLDNNNKK